MDYKIILALVVISGLFLFWYLRKGSSNSGGCDDKSDDIKIVRLIYEDDCGHCIEFKPTWEQLKDKYNGQSIVFEEIDNKKLSNRMTHVPTIVMEKEGEQLEFKDERSLEKLSKFVEL